MSVLNSPDWLHGLTASMPFIMSLEGKLKLNMARIMETIIFAVVGGLLSSYVTVKVMEVRLDQLEKKVDKIYTDIYKPMLR